MSVPSDGITAASSGCAQSGAHRFALERAEAAQLALTRLDAGVAELCLDCGGPIPAERLEALVTTVRCAPCAGPGQVDTKWCR